MYKKKNRDPLDRKLCPFIGKKIYSRDKKSEERKKENDAEEAKKKELMVKNNRKTKIREK